MKRRRLSSEEAAKLLPGEGDVGLGREEEETEWSERLDAHAEHTRRRDTRERAVRTRRQHERAAGAAWTEEDDGEHGLGW